MTLADLWKRYLFSPICKLENNIVEIWAKKGCRVKTEKIILYDNNPQSL